MEIENNKSNGYIRIWEDESNGHMYMLWGQNSNAPMPNEETLQSLKETGDFTFTDDGVVTMVR